RGDGDAPDRQGLHRCRDRCYGLLLRRAAGGIMSVQRRDFLKAGGAAVAAGLAGCATMKSASGPARARVVVVGGGYGGATAARYVRLLDPTIDVILVEQNESFVSCPLSNMVLGGFRSMGDITRPYSGLEARGVRVVRDTAIAIDPEKKQV